MTVVFLGMRAVMAIGGACASGGPFVPIRPCPDGVPILLVGGIWIGLILAFAYTLMVVGTDVPSIAGLFWPGLFLSLGWNFLDYGFDPPGAGGVAWGWLVPGVLFFLMGGIPLWWVMRSIAEPDRGPVGTVLAPPGGAAVLRMVRDMRNVRIPSVASADLVVDTLERLEELRRSGAIDDEEYERVKRRVIGEQA